MSNLCQVYVKSMSNFFDINFTIQPRLTFLTPSAEGSCCPHEIPTAPIPLRKGLSLDFPFFLAVKHCRFYRMTICVPVVHMHTPEDVTFVFKSGFATPSTETVQLAVPFNPTAFSISIGIS